MAIGLALGAGCRSGRDIKTYEGKVILVDVSANGIALDISKRNDNRFVVGDGVTWLGLDGSWRQSGTPECLPPMSRGARVSIDTVDIGDHEAVVRVRCLSLPTEVYWAGEDGESPFTAYCAATEGKDRPISKGNDDPC